jgi:hypothetical protein
VEHGAPAPTRRRVRQVAALLAATRLAVGAGALVAPEAVLRAFFGAGLRPPARTALRVALGARDLAVAVTTLRSVNGDLTGPLRAGAACDALDAGAAALAWRALPRLGRAAVIGSALTSVVAHLATAAVLEREVRP